MQLVNDDRDHHAEPNVRSRVPVRPPGHSAPVGVAQCGRPPESQHRPLGGQHGRASRTDPEAADLRRYDSPTPSQQAATATSAQQCVERVQCAASEQECTAAPGMRPTPRYLSTPAPARPPVRLAQTVSDTWAEAWSEASARPHAALPKVVVNLVHEVDQAGVDQEAPPPVFLPLRLALWDADTALLGEDLGDETGFIDNGSGYCLVNPFKLPESYRSQIKWMVSDKKLQSASGHSAQGAGPKLMCLMGLRLLDAATGKSFVVLQKFYSSTSIPFGLLLGRSICMNQALGRHVDGPAHELVVGQHRVALERLPCEPPAERTKLPTGVAVLCVEDRLLQPRATGYVECTADASDRPDGTACSAVRGARFAGDHPTVPYVSYPQRLVLDGHRQRVCVTNPTNDVMLYAAGSLVAFAGIVSPGAPAAALPTHRNKDEDPFGVGDVSGEAIADAVLLSLEQQWDATPEPFATLSKDMPAMFAGFNNPQPDEHDAVRQWRLRFLQVLSEPLVLEELVAAVVQSDATPASAMGPPTHGGTLETEDTEDATFRGGPADTLFSSKAGDFDHIHFDPDLASVVTDPEELARLKAEVRRRLEAKAKIAQEGGGPLLSGPVA